MNQFSPKPDLWSKIQQRKDFDLQVKEHISNLPVKTPKADLWSAIESELDQKTPVIPLWKYGMAAASIALIFTLSGIAYFEFGEKVEETPFATEVIVETSEITSTDSNLLIDVKPMVKKPKQIEAKKPNTNTPQLSKRIVPAPIEISTLDLPELSIEKTLVSQVIIPAMPEQAASPTLHKVQVSWGFQDKNTLRTTFGASDSGNITSQQIGRANQTPSSIKIKFKKQ